jgi:hypothetical protein
VRTRTNEGRCLSEKVVGDAQYAEGRARSDGGRRGRQQLSLFRHLVAQDDHYIIRLPSSANRAYDNRVHDAPRADKANDNRGAHSARNDP